MIVVIFGPPGSGKGTQAALVAKRIGVPHVATGDILRAETAKGTPLGREVEPIMRAGHLVPDDLVVRVIEARLAEPDAAAGALLDGFPRTIPQAVSLDEMLERNGRRVEVVVPLNVPEDVLAERVRRRAPEGRPDDTPDAFVKRMHVYRTETAPLLDYYRSKGTRIAEVDGVGGVDTVTERIADALKAAQAS